MLFLRLGLNIHIFKLCTKNLKCSYIFYLFNYSSQTLALVIIMRRAVLCGRGAVLHHTPLQRFFRGWNTMDPSRISGVWALCSMRLSVELYPLMAKPY